MRTGIATVPLDYGRCPYWLFERMKRLSRAIVLAVTEEFGTDELLKRLSDPVWFQSLGCVIGFDWNSSGLTTTTTGALKEGIRGLESHLGLFICGGKGKTSKKTPQQIQEWGEFSHFSPQLIDELIYASKTSAKVDNSLLQDGFQLYHHNLIFSKSGNWTVIQQGMSDFRSQARRYHWSSEQVKDFIEEPHSGIISAVKTKPLNLTAKESKSNKEISVKIVQEEPDTFLKNIKRISGFSEMELNNIEFHWHPVVKEKFNLKRLQKIIKKAHFLEPKNFEELITVEGVGPRTIRALSLISEIIYGAKPSYEDPARYSFAHGGKDGTPYFVDKDVYDKTISVIERGIKKSQVSIREKNDAQKRLNAFLQ